MREGHLVVHFSQTVSDSVAKLLFIMNLRAKGFTKEETDMMTKTNPAKLFGLPLLADVTQ